MFECVMIIMLSYRLKRGERVIEMFLKKKKATAEMTTAILCKSNLKKSTFGTVAEYLEDDEIESIVSNCIEVLAKRKNSRTKVIACIISKNMAKIRSFDDIAVNIDSRQLQEILTSCGCIMAKRRCEKVHKNNKM